MAKRALVIGLDCAAPQFVFDRWLPELPTIRSLTERGSFGVLRSCDPPITVPAWSVMTSSRSPGSLGFYGFRNRRDHSYDQLVFADSRAVRVPRVWDVLSAQRARRDRARRAADVSAEPGQRRDGLVLPHSRHADKPVHVSARAEGRDRAGRRPLHGRRRELPHRGEGSPARADRGDDRQAVPARRAPARDAAVGSLLHGRDGHRPDPPRLLALHRPRAPAVRAGQPVRARDARLLPAPRREDRPPAAVRRRRDGGARRLGPRREADGRRHLRQRVAAARGIPRAARGADRADAPHAGSHRLVAHRRLGRGRLLLPPLPQRRGARAGGRSSRPATTSACGTS